jgi:predicted MFS family arabinose efflux permease
VGGIIVTWFSWRWIFFVNVPIGLVAIVLILKLIPQERAATGQSFDLLGSILVAACFVCAALACEGLAGGGVGLAASAGLWIASAVLLALYIRHARRHPAPVIDLGLLKLTNYRRAMLGGSVYRIAVGGVPFLLPLALQLAHGVSALTSGFILLLPAFGGLAMKFFSTALLRWHGYRLSFLIHGTLSALFLAILAICGTDLIRWALAVVLVAFGFSRSLLMNAYGTVAYAEVTREQMASATSFFLSIQNLTNGLGIVFAALSARFAQQLLPAASSGIQFSLAFAALAICAAVSVGLSLLFERNAGADLVRHASASSHKKESP